MIKFAAIKRIDGEIVKGKDHYRCIKNSPFGSCKNGVQGFLDDKGEFKTRKEAYIIAFEAGQLNDETYLPDISLMSEDIWYYGKCHYDDSKGYCFKKDTSLGKIQ